MFTESQKMNNDKISFIKANNGIIVEKQIKDWDGSHTERELLTYPTDNFTSKEELEKFKLQCLSKALNVAFPEYKIAIISVVSKKE